MENFKRKLIEKIALKRKVDLEIKKLKKEVNAHFTDFQDKIHRKA